MLERKETCRDQDFIHQKSTVKSLVIVASLQSLNRSTKSQQVSKVSKVLRDSKVLIGLDNYL
jgi:hypothetical protein